MSDITFDDDWTVFRVRAVEMDALDGLGITIRTARGTSVYQVRDGELWKHACSLSVYDDGRMIAFVAASLTPRQQSIVGGILEEAWRGGVEKCRREQWGRCRASTKRRGFYMCLFSVRVDEHETGAQTARADMELVAAASDWAVLDSSIERAMRRSETAA